MFNKSAQKSLTKRIIPAAFPAVEKEIQIFETQIDYAKIVLPFTGHFRRLWHLIFSNNFYVLGCNLFATDWSRCCSLQIQQLPFLRWAVLRFIASTCSRVYACHGAFLLMDQLRGREKKRSFQ